MPTFNVNTVDWDELYNGEASYAPGNPGWNIGELQPELAALERQGRFRSPVLDSGCGVGITTLALAKKGYDAVGLDLSSTAIERARRAAENSGQNVEFGVADLSKSTGYENYFYTVVDGLVFHCLPEQLRNGLHRIERTGAAAWREILCPGFLDRRLPAQCRLRATAIHRARIARDRRQAPNRRRGAAGACVGQRAADSARRFRIPQRDNRVRRPGAAAVVPGQRSPQLIPRPRGSAVATNWPPAPSARAGGVRPTAPARGTMRP